MTRLHYLVRVGGYSKREARMVLHEAERAFRAYNRSSGYGDKYGDKTIAKIHKAKRVRHCKFTMPVRDGAPF